MKTVVIVLTFMVLGGCATRPLMMDWTVCADGIMIASTRPLPDNYPGMLEPGGNLVRLKIDPEVSYGMLADVFVNLGTNGLQSIVCLSNGKEVPVRMGFPGDYFPYCVVHLEGATYMSSGESFVHVDPALECTPLTLLSYWHELKVHDPVVETLEAAKNSDMNWFVLYCDTDTTYGTIEQYFIEAYSKGYATMFFWGISLEDYEYVKQEANR